MQSREEINVMLEKLQEKIGDKCISGLFPAGDSECEWMWETKSNRTKRKPSPIHNEIGGDIDRLLYQWDEMTPAARVDATNRLASHSSCKRCRIEKRTQRAASQMYSEFLGRIEHQKQNGIANIRPQQHNTQQVENEGNSKTWLKICCDHVLTSCRRRRRRRSCRSSPSS